MNEVQISLKKMAAFLEEKLDARLVEQTEVWAHFKSNHNELRLNKLEEAKHTFDISQEYNILQEFTFLPCGVLFVNNGHCLVNEELCKRFGGCISNNKCWILCNRPKNHVLWGYTGNRPPTAAEIIRCIEELSL